MFLYKYFISFFLCFFVLLTKSYFPYSLEVLCSGFYIAIFTLKNKNSFLFCVLLVLLKVMFTNVNIFLDLSIIFFAAFLLSSFQEVFFSESAWFDYFSFLIFFIFYKISWLIFFKKSPIDILYLEKFFFDFCINTSIYFFLKSLWKEEEVYGEF